jgi:hypothetical protein
LGKSDMSCLDLLLKIFVLDVEILAQFCHAVGVCDIDAPLVVDSEGNGADALNLFSVNDLTLRLIVDAEGCGAERDHKCAAEIWNQVISRAETLAATSSAFVDEWAMVG